MLIILAPITGGVRCCTGPSPPISIPPPRSRFSLSLSLMVSEDVKHHVYLLVLVQPKIYKTKSGKRGVGGGETVGNCSV